MPFPTQFPQAALAELVGHINGSCPLPLRKAVEDVYDVLGYGMGIAIPFKDSMPPMAMAEMTEDQKHFELATASNSPSSINWQILLPILLELLKRFLGGG